MATEPLDVRAVLAQWLQRLAKHPNRPAVDPAATFGASPLRVYLLDFPIPYFKTTCTLAEVDDEAEVDEDQGIEGAEPEADAAVGGAAEDKAPGDEAGFEIAAGGAGITVVGDNVYQAGEYVAMQHAYCSSSDIDTTEPSRPQNTSYIRVDVECDAVRIATPPAVLAMSTNGDVELVYRVLTRSQRKSYVTIQGTGIDAVMNMFLRMYTTDMKNRWVLKVVSAAVRVQHQNYAVPVPQRHHHAIFAAVQAGHAKPITQEQQGFILSDSAFANRKTALAAAVLSGQLPYDPERTELFSEDLW
jgi:hypothetical protein